MISINLGIEDAAKKITIFYIVCGKSKTEYGKIDESIMQTTQFNT